jgi:CDP-diacylglycerol---glycerol-3-phosphate 3-phosphatidyltransferase
VIPVSRGGKAKTALLSVAIGWYVCPFPPSVAKIGPWLLAAAVVVTVVTGADYVVRALRLRRAALKRGASPRDLARDTAVAPAAVPPSDEPVP